MKKFRKSMNVSFVLLLIMVFTIGIPVVYFIYTAKDINNTKKVLQEAAYSGALAGTYAIDINGFQNGVQAGRSTSFERYPLDSSTGSPVAFMQQLSKSVRWYTSTSYPLNTRDCLGGAAGTRYPGSTQNVAAKEIVATVLEYLNANLNRTSGNGRAVYTDDDFTIAMNFERSGLVDPISNVSVDDTNAPYNKVTVSVVLNYKPTLLQSLNVFKDVFKDPIPIYGTSSAKTKTIL